MLSQATAAWEVRVHAVQRVLGRKGLLSAHELRANIEALDEQRYARLGYYEKWALSLRAHLVARGVLTDAEIDRFLGPPPKPVDEEKRFAVGDAVRVRREDVIATRWRRPHLRVPGYLFGCVGAVTEFVGVFEDPEQAALIGEAHKDRWPREPLYRVRFRHADVWRPAAGEAEHANPLDTIDVEVRASLSLSSSLLRPCLSFAPAKQAPPRVCARAGLPELADRRERRRAHVRERPARPGAHGRLRARRGGARAQDAARALC